MLSLLLFGATALLALAAADLVDEGGDACPEGACGYGCEKACECEAGVLDCGYEYKFDKLADELEDGETLLGETCAPYDDGFVTPDNMQWAMGLAAVTAPVMAFGIGANDIANSWATSVGSGAISVRNAVMMGAVFEFAGAVTLGFGVSKTIAKGVSKPDDPDCWACGYCNSQVSLMVGGMAGALAGASSFLMLATYFALPVSTTHSIVGGIAGMTVVGAGPGCLNWKWKGLSGIIASWFISPLLSGLIAVICWSLSKRFIMDSKRPRRNTFRLIPILFGASASLCVLMMMFKSKALKKRVSPEAPYLWKILISLICGLLFALLSHFLAVPWIRKQLPSNQPDFEDPAKPKKTAGGPEKVTEMALTTAIVIAKTKGGDSPENSVSKDSDGTGSKDSNSSSVAGSVDLAAIGYEGACCDKIDALYAFKYVLVFIACLECFAHGSNDTANAAGPFTAVYKAYTNGLYECQMPDTPVWIMASGGFFLSLGVVMYGRNVIKTIGTDIASVDYHKAFWIELAATVATITATVLNFPVSTTHCKIGAVVGVGFIAPKVVAQKNVNWPLLTKIVFTWVVTIPVAGSISAVLVVIIEAAMK